MEGREEVGGFVGASMVRTLLNGLSKRDGRNEIEGDGNSPGKPAVGWNQCAES